MPWAASFARPPLIQVPREARVDLGVVLEREAPLTRERGRPGGVPASTRPPSGVANSSACQENHGPGMTSSGASVSIGAQPASGRAAAPT